MVSPNHGYTLSVNSFSITTQTELTLYPVPEGSGTAGVIQLGQHGWAVAIDIHELKPTMLTWVPHIMCFIVPRQLVELGDQTHRSCDASRM